MKHRMNHEILSEELGYIFSDWENDFDIDIEQNDYWNGHHYFSVMISHYLLGDDYEFSARVNGSGECEMDYNEDCWIDINAENVFSYMWFKEAKQKTIS